MIEQYPLSWPTGWKRTAKPKWSRFGVGDRRPTIAAAVDCLQTELVLLIGKTEVNKSLVISTNLKYWADGFPYSNQKEPDDKGVAVYFNMPGKTLDEKVPTVIACDSFDKIGCNIYAVAKTIAAMRGIKRWGCSELLDRAFTGFKALPEQTEKGWAEILEVDLEGLTFDPLRAAYLKKVKVLHPDAGGDADAFHKVVTAYNLGVVYLKGK